MNQSPRTCCCCCCCCLGLLLPCTNLSLPLPAPRCVWECSASAQRSPHTATLVWACVVLSTLVLLLVCNCEGLLPLALLLVCNCEGLLPLALLLVCNCEGLLPLVLLLVCNCEGLLPLVLLSCLLAPLSSIPFGWLSSAAADRSAHQPSRPYSSEIAQTCRCRCA